MDDGNTDWRGHPLLPMYVDACRNSAPMGRTLLLLWHPDVHAFLIFDAAQQRPSYILGWTVIGVAERGEITMAPKVTVTRGAGLTMPRADVP